MEVKEKRICIKCGLEFTSQSTHGRPDQVCYRSTCREERECSKCGKKYLRTFGDKKTACPKCRSRGFSEHLSPEVPEEKSTVDIAKLEVVESRDPLLHYMKLVEDWRKKSEEAESIKANLDYQVQTLLDRIDNFTRSHPEIDPLVERLAKPVIERRAIEKKRVEERDKAKENLENHQEFAKKCLEAERDS